MICASTHIGDFDGCEVVDISATYDAPLVLTYYRTGRKCSYPDGNFGVLATGFYSFEFGGLTLTFSVV